MQPMTAPGAAPSRSTGRNLKRSVTKESTIEARSVGQPLGALRAKASTMERILAVTGKNGGYSDSKLASAPPCQAEGGGACEAFLQPKGSLFTRIHDSDGMKRKRSNGCSEDPSPSEPPLYRKKQRNSLPSELHDCHISGIATNDILMLAEVAAQSKKRTPHQRGGTSPSETTSGDVSPNSLALARFETAIAHRKELEMSFFHFPRDGGNAVCPQAYVQQLFRQADTMRAILFSPKDRCRLSYCEALDYVIPDRSGLLSNGGNFVPAGNRPMLHFQHMSSVRNAVCGWLLYVCRKSPAPPISDHTFHLAVTLLDRFLRAIIGKTLAAVNQHQHKRPTTRELRQGVSVSYSAISDAVETGRNIVAVALCCLYLASKVEDCDALEIDDTMWLSDTSGKRSVLKWEAPILNAMEFNISAPTALDFLGVFLRAAPSLTRMSFEELGPLIYPDEIHHPLPVGVESSARYLVDLCCLNAEVSSFEPYLVAASCLVLVVCYTTLENTDGELVIPGSKSSPDARPKLTPQLLPTAVKEWLERYSHDAEAIMDHLKIAVATVAALVASHLSTPTNVFAKINAARMEELQLEARGVREPKMGYLKAPDALCSAPWNPLEADRKHPRAALYLAWAQMTYHKSRLGSSKMTCDV